MLVAVQIAYGEGLDALLQIDDELGLVRVKSPGDGVAEFWLDRGREYWSWLKESQRTGRDLLDILTWRVCHGHIYGILYEADGGLVPDDQFDWEFERLLAERCPAVYERILRARRRGSA